MKFLPFLSFSVPCLSFIVHLPYICVLHLSDHYDRTGPYLTFVSYLDPTLPGIYCYDSTSEKTFIFPPSGTKNSLLHCPRPNTLKHDTYLSNPLLLYPSFVIVVSSIPTILILDVTIFTFIFSPPPQFCVPQLRHSQNNGPTLPFAPSFLNFY